MNLISNQQWLDETINSISGFEGKIETAGQEGFKYTVNAFVKRAMDILLSLALGIFFLPIGLLAALLIRLDSGGPIFYRQERLGKDGRKITIYKFRTMHVDGDNLLKEYFKKNPEARHDWELKQKLPADPRITHIGKWMREFSVDEMPQLLNVLKGEMSLVGPRPILAEQKILYGEGIEAYRSMRPGLTGLWQVSGRNHTSFSQRAIYDVYYVHNWSLWLDVYILFRTVWVVLSRDGAY
jgi:Undecaprenyl-phosphate galactose phosphotransferase WbaP